MRIYSEVASARLVQDLAIEKTTENVQNMKSHENLFILLSSSSEFFKPFKKQSLQIFLKYRKTNNQAYCVLLKIISLLSLSKHYIIINLPIFTIFSFLTVPLIHFALLTSICSPYLSSNLLKLVDLFSLLLQLSGILFLSLSVLLPPVHRFIQLLRLTFSPLRSISSSIGILDFDPAPCMTLLWVTVWASAWLA